MINKIIASSIFVSCLFAIFLSMSGVQAPIWFGNEFRGFIVATNKELAEYKVAIPNIPFIPTMDFLSFEGNFFEIVVQALVNFIQLWVRFINGLISVLNFVVLALNTIINLLEFVFILLKNFITLRDEIIA